MGAQRSHPLTIDDRRTVYADEQLRVEEFLEPLHRATQHVRIAVGVHAHVVAGGIDPFDRIDIYVRDFARVPDRQSIRERVPRVRCFGNRPLKGQLPARELADELQQLGAVLRGEFLVAGQARALDGFAEALVVDRLQQVVECIGIECLQRELVVGRNENNDGHVAAGESSQNLEAVDAWHLHVQENDIRQGLANGVDRLAAVPALATDLDVVEPLQTDLEPSPGEFLVVNDQRFQHLLYRTVC
jgi:hypothetical protein